MFRKKTTLLVLALAVLAALAIPALALAKTEWIKNKGTLATNDEVHLEGTLKFEGTELGTVHCQSKATMTLQLTAGETAAAHVTQITDSAPTTDCLATGGLIKANCGEKSLEELKLIKNASAEGTLTKSDSEASIDITKVELRAKFVHEKGGAECMTVTLTSIMTPLVATLDSTNAATQATLSGELNTDGWNFGKVSGVMKVKAGQSGVYGLATF